MADSSGLPPLHLQLAGPAARPAGHPDHAFVLPALAVGEYPTPDDAGWLRDTCRVSAVISLQDDHDLERKGVRLDALRRAYGRVAIAFARYPVADGDAVALRGVLDAVVTDLHQRLAGGERVYLHCNAGLNRAPTVAVAYLHRHHGLTLDDACAAVKARRACVPYMRALRAHYGD
ncbi:MAG TPA: dual specificity protein phosphatase family protein [Candidatus Dormibacteraeota bacterium]|nr:dual specificity protein phosphatase family protein [Candidatus Dormibacteraeota bacterium]